MLKKIIFIVLQYINGEYYYIWKAGIQESFSPLISNKPDPDVWVGRAILLLSFKYYG